MLLMRDMTEIQYVSSPVAPHPYPAFRNTPPDSPNRGDLADIWSTIPSSLDPRDLLNNVTLLDGAKKALDSRDFLTGEDAKQRYGLKKKHPIVLIPGIISTGLESWSTEPVARTFFRKRLWGTSTMIRVSYIKCVTWRHGS
jgi:phospholipid:diacylglycerol acyltransferase